MSPSSQRWILPAILALAVTLRVLAWHGAVLMTNDGPDFLWQAERLLAGDAESALRHPYHPLYGALAALLTPLAGSTVHGALLVSILSGVAIVLAVRALAARAFPGSRAIPEAAALLAAVHTRLLITTSDIQSDGLFAALCALSMATLLAAVERGGCARRHAAAGMLAGLAYLTRPEGLFLVGVAALAWLVAWRRPARATAGLALFLAGAAVCMLPYVLVLHEFTGYWGLSLKPSIARAGLAHSVTALPLPPDCPIASPRVHRAPPGSITAMPGVLAPAAAAVSAPTETTAETTDGPADEEQPDGGEDDDGASADKLARGAPSALPAAFAEAATVALGALRWDTGLLALCGLFVLGRTRRGLLAAGLAVACAWLTVCAVHWWLSRGLAARHTLLATIVLLPLAGAGLVRLWTLAGTWRAGIVLRVVLAAIVTIHATSGSRPRHAGSESRLAALAFAAAHTTPEQRLAVHRRKDGFYSDRPVLVLVMPCFDAEVVQRLKRHGVALLVLDEDRVLRHAPHWLTGGGFIERARFGSGDDTVLVLERAPG